MIKWEKPFCDNCHNKSCSIVFDDVTSWEHKGKFRLVKCRKCGLVYFNPRPTKKYISKFYPNETYWNDKVNPQKAYGYLYNLIFNGKKEKKILDIGAGNGLFLTEFKKRGWEVTGVEFSEHAVMEAKKFGLRLKRGDFLDYKFPNNYFDVVTLNNVLEHLYKPKETLKGVSKTIRKDGILVVTVPNIESIGEAIFKKDWHAIQPPRHLYQFTPYTLSEMVKEAGFKDINIYHNYWDHNYYSLFESFRFSTSPKFKKGNLGGLSKGSVKDLETPGDFSFIREAGKVAAKCFATVVSFIEPFLGKGEVITLYAKKV